MARPKGGYRNAAGEKRPGVTTITALLKTSPALERWNLKQGIAFGRAEALGQDTKGLHPDEITKRAKLTGTYGHDLIEAAIWERDKPPPPEGFDEEMVRDAEMSLSAYHRWREGSRVKIVETEAQMFSEEHQFGGCPDAIGTLVRADGSTLWTLPDWKTSKGVFSEYIIQIAAYGILARECRDIELDQYDLLRCDKESGTFVHYSWTREQIVPLEPMFLRLRAIYDEVKTLKKLCN